MYKLICFDLDDTLWPCMPTIQFAEQTLYSWLSENKPQITQVYDIEQLRAKRKLLIQQQPELMHDLSAARKVHLKQLAAETGDTDAWVEAAFDVFYEARQKVDLYDDVLPVLSELKNNYILAALTNGNAHISKTGLSDYFDFQVSAADVQASKPDPAMFVTAMKMASVSPQHTIHVGDHPLHDIQGGRNAGIDTVWLKRFAQTWNRGEPEPDQQFDNLNQFYSWLSELK